MAKTIWEHCKKPTNTAVIDHDQNGKCLATFDSESKYYKKGCGYQSADEIDLKFADEIINQD
ncbi:hypothetical protein [Vibrio vulnificus]|uniref:hypothetical protein n=1 Tax=Vibrio vulnificus TaxID=672 RepID=UPI0028C0B171|nr:hypothetical protein [Vibrio vulnificus]HDY7951918.1 hypothetical protein [Vibrio vulnificus]